MVFLFILSLAGFASSDCPDVVVERLLSGWSSSSKKTFDLSAQRQKHLPVSREPLEKPKGKGNFLFGLSKQGPMALSGAIFHSDDRTLSRERGQEIVKALLTLRADEDLQLLQNDEARAVMIAAVKACVASTDGDMIDAAFSVVEEYVAALKKGDGELEKHKKLLLLNWGVIRLYAERFVRFD